MGININRASINDGANDEVIAFTFPAGTPTWTRDATANDSDKSFTVPAGKVWDLKSIRSEIAATATVGNRVLRVLINNGADNIFAQSISAVAASQTGVIRLMPNVTYDTTLGGAPLLSAGLPNVGLRAPMEPMTIPAGYIIRVYDSAAVDAAADDLTVVLHYIEVDV